ncbi:phosphatidylinositol-3,5-bisphosphate 5-phosphatase, partial [Ascosphaera aggregata]
MEEELDNAARPPHPSEVPAPEGQHGPHTLMGLVFRGKCDKDDERAVLSRRESFATSTCRLEEQSTTLPSASSSTTHRIERQHLRVPSNHHHHHHNHHHHHQQQQQQQQQPPSSLSRNLRERSNSIISDASSERSRLIEDASTLLDEDQEEQNNLENQSEGRSRTAGRSRFKANVHQRHEEKNPGTSQIPWYGISRMQKFSLYETATRFYLVGMDLKERRFRILKIERTTESEELRISDDDMLYSKKEINQLLDAVDDGNKISGGLKLRCCTWGLLGLIRFTGTYYMLLITKRSQVAMLGGHFIYQIDGTELVPLSSSISAKTKTDKAADEARFLTIMNNLDLTRSFYFSYSYDLTRTLQFNITKAREAVQRGIPENNFRNVETMFEWNHYLLQPVLPLLKNPYDWCFPIIHGYVDQANISVFGRLIYVTLIARRSRYFAGARFLKRGANDLGYVANDVETEQIVSDTLTTSFHGPGPRLYANPRYTSYVQHRGSIPLYWSQDSNGVAPKPDIEMHLVDPFYSAAALHFDNLFERYGAPVYVLNLVKSRERVPRESKLLHEYTNAVRYLNQFLPEDKKIVYKAFDMSRAAKSRDQDVISSLERIAEDIIPRTSLFKNGSTYEEGLMLQNGVTRTNCIDCLDRTNAAQFVIGKRALGHQLHALGIIDTTSIEYDTDAVNMITNMWHNHGDTIAVQYGGSQLVNTMATYRKTNQWAGQSRDMVESFKRYYNNSFLDAQRQEAYNLFLGNYVYTPDEPMLWDLSTDYYLHHSNPKQFLCFKRRSYIKWFTPGFLEKRTMPELRYHQRKYKPQQGMPTHNADNRSPHFASDDGDEIGRYDDYWMEYYRPLGMS